MTLKFGTDGIRGVANQELTPELAVAVGRAVARVVAGGRPVVIGRDTRLSGPIIEAALVAGCASEDIEVRRAGIVPTPAVAAASAAGPLAGIVVSASHNPWSDNGIKIFAPGGRKLDDDTEARLESEIAVLRRDPSPPSGSGGLVVDAPDVAADWARGVIASVEGRRLDGLDVVVDLANGAAVTGAGDVLRELGVALTIIGDEPDGRNINDGCGSTHPGRLQAAVRERGADAGLAFDGDADRVVAVDHEGAVVDGDQIIAMCARDLADRGQLRHRTVVVTVMANLGFRMAMDTADIRVVETPVGDRAVTEALQAGGYSLGGEQSGHIVFARHATTGDGLLTGVQLLDLVVRSGRTLQDLAAQAMTRLPQVLVNVPVAEQIPDVADRIAGAIESAEAELGEQGRVLVRPSGTEPVVRVMVEAVSEDAARSVAAGLEEAVRTISPT